MLIVNVKIKGFTGTDKPSLVLKMIKMMAEREGFEPSVGFLLHTLSKRAP